MNLAEIKYQFTDAENFTQYITMENGLKLNLLSKNNIQYHFIPDRHDKNDFGDFELFLIKILNMYVAEK